MNRIKYLASYETTPYGVADQEYMAGYRSLKAAMDNMWSIQNRSFDYSDTYRENAEGVYYPWSQSSGGHYGAEDTDRMYLYTAIFEDGGYILGDVAYRLVTGPRKGIRPEKF